LYFVPNARETQEKCEDGSSRGKVGLNDCADDTTTSQLSIGFLGPSYSKPKEYEVLDSISELEFFSNYRGIHP
jgi:hypothetical protein